METKSSKKFYEALEAKGVSRRYFLKYCTALTATLGLSYSCVGQVAEKIEKAAAIRPPVAWLHFSECTGCSEAFLRTPDVGGISAAAPNPGGYKGVKDAIGVDTINLSGCPFNPLNLLGTILKYLDNEKIELDDYGRPLFAYGETVHDNCPRLEHYENDEFVEEFGSKEAELGYCLYKMGCRGPETYNNCPTAKFNDATSFPIQAGHPCIGCSEPDFWDEMTPFYEEM